MDQDENAYLYGDDLATTEETSTSSATLQQAPNSPPTTMSESLPENSGGDTPMANNAPGRTTKENDLEEGEEEEEEEEEEEIEFVIERKDGTRPEPPPQPSRYNQVRMAPTRPTPESSGSAKGTTPQPTTNTTPQPPTGPASSQQSHPPTGSSSKLDLNGNPTYHRTPIKSISLDSDTLLPSDKPWRKPGADVTDYFNYGFDEFTWTAYCQKQESLREEFDPGKMMEQMMLLSGITGGLGMPGIVVDPSAVGVGGMDMNAAAAMMGFNPAGGGGGSAAGGAPAAAVGTSAGGTDMNMQAMGAYGGYDQNMMQQQQQQQQQQSVRGAYGRGGRGRRGW
ncbi:Fip1-domain-containing protein [Choiromyces venosus 120613-1]|uniref:Fip1-domain-containing protein n=1 Tax=Choiromyces venosus 120613-1 TaxID=1336337 RepID=A0A3N4IW42_9PEZI|nr:Fip1-domain-containing protein [Choiromyces venosus 120613-1]